jgi:microcystin-dependent protein
MSNNNCGCTSASSSSVEDSVITLQETVDNLTSFLAPFINRHPILFIEDASDIALFDYATGKGSGDYALYAVCDGQSHVNSKGVTITTPNLVDRFIVGSGNLYNTGDTGGTASETLSINQIPAHSHPLTDPGHDHNVVDPGHTHGITDPTHTHASSSTDNHTHAFTTNTTGNHSHPIPDLPNSFEASGASPDSFAAASPVAYSGSGVAGDHFHTGTTNPPTNPATVSVDAAATGVSAQSAFTGATVASEATGITMANSGGGLSHNNLPPYYAGVFIKLIG